MKLPSLQKIVALKSGQEKNNLPLTSRICQDGQKESHVSRHMVHDLPVLQLLLLVPLLLLLLPLHLLLQYLGHVVAFFLLLYVSLFLL